MLDVMLEPGFFAHVEELAGYFGQKLGALAARHPDVIDSVQGLGLMRGIRCKGTNGDLVNALLGQHMLTVGAGDNQVRLLPALTVTENEIDEAVDALDSACAQLSSGAG